MLQELRFDLRPRHNPPAWGNSVDGIFELLGRRWLGSSIFGIGRSVAAPTFRWRRLFYSMCHLFFSGGSESRPFVLMLSECHD